MEIFLGRAEFKFDDFSEAFEIFDVQGQKSDAFPLAGRGDEGIVHKGRDLYLLKTIAVA